MLKNEDKMNFKFLTDNFDRKPVNYWKLQDENPSLERLSSDILRNYICDYGESNKERMESLMKGVNYCGFKGISIVGDGGWKIQGKHSTIFQEFVNEIRNISRGKFEFEVYDISVILRKYKGKITPWYKKIFNPPQL